MDIKVCANISSEYKNIEICINAPEKNEEVQRLENELLLKTSGNVQNIIAMQDNNIFILNVEHISKFYSEEKSVFCKTDEGIYRVKEKLYALEEILSSKDFIRISNSAIININHVKCFNTSIIGKIIVKFKDGTEEFVAKRKTSEIMKFLRERRN